MKTKILNWLKALALPFAIWVVFSIITHGRYAKPASVMSIFRTAVVPIIMGMTLAFGMMMNMWNFAAGAILIACSIFGAYFAQVTGSGVPGVAVFSVLTGIVLNAFMGVLYRLMRVPCLVLSLGLVMVYEALPNILVPNATGKISLLDGYLGQAPWCFVILAIMVAVFYYINTYTAFGADMRTIGANIRIADNAGVNIDRVKFLSFIISGVFLGVAGLVQISTSVTLTAVSGIASVAMIFDGFMGVFLAMVLTRFVNFTAAVVIGTLTIRILSSGLVACGFSSEIRGILTGVFLFAVITFSANSNAPAIRKEQERIAKEADAEYEQQKAHAA